ncbi:MAG: biotin--[acetyl-CoA-carboxylase] ligase [Candidatus Riflebacteria bacterium]|nr:biotin--[acetyl-CoA-carboxylase] ligase [Candidatus Riflebacteria bacterium]
MVILQVALTSSFPETWDELPDILHKIPGFESHAFIHVGEIDSTNNSLKADWSLNPVPERVMAADHQTAGRGQFGRSWWDNPGDSLLFSFSWPCIEGPVRGFPVSIATGLALYRALHELFPWASGAFWLKWPNDLWSGNAKVGGILVESRIATNGIGRLVVGIGVNLRGLRPEIPSGESARSVEEAIGTTLRPELPRLPQAGTDIIRQKILHPARLLAAILTSWSNLSEEYDSSESLVRAWEAASGPMWGRKIIITGAGDEILNAESVGLCVTGGLRIRLPDGSERLICSAEKVRFA